MGEINSDFLFLLMLVIFISGGQISRSQDSNNNMKMLEREYL